MKGLSLFRLLVVYAYHRYPLRPTVRDHLYCFRESPQCRATYINLRYRRLGSLLLRQRFDLIVFDTTFAGQRWSRQQFARVAAKAMPLRKYSAPKAIIPQDDFLNTDVLDDFINTCGIGYVFSALPETEWPAVYANAKSSTRFQRVLTGYLSPASLTRIRQIATTVPVRDIDIGYRTAWQFWYGRHGFKRQQLADAVRAAAPRYGLTTDIDTEQKKEVDRLRGDNWFRYLLRCKYVLGTDGGTSVLDRDGRIRARTEAYRAAHPEAPFEDVAAACFAEEDGRHQLFGLSPRHLEACATRTCQILLEGEYNGLLHPGRHYLEVKADFSNLDTVMAQVTSDAQREAIVAQAYQDIVASGRFGYDRFVHQVLSNCLEERPAQPVSVFQRWFWEPWMALRDRASWLTVWFVDTVFKPKH